MDWVGTSYLYLASCFIVHVKDIGVVFTQAGELNLPQRYLCGGKRYRSVNFGAVSGQYIAINNPSDPSSHSSHIHSSFCPISCKCDSLPVLEPSLYSPGSENL